MLFSILFSTGDSSYQEWRDDFGSYETAVQIDLYNADTHQVDNQLRGAFQYDGTRRIEGSKKVFSFYLKGENPGAPKGTVFQNVINFQISKNRY